ncbi:MAG: helix-turn-helix domain-containing protein [Alphaproteobacteria bacterium]
MRASRPGLARDPASARARSAPLSIGALARRTACKVETIRYYEHIGLLPPPARTAGGHRQYSRDNLMRLTFIRRARDLGFTLEGVRRLLQLVDERGQSCAEVQRLAQGHLGTIRDKIGDLRALEAVLEQMVATCEGGTVPDCPIIEALFRGEP